MVFGNLIEIAGIVVAFVLILIAPDVPDTLVRFLLYSVSWGSLVFFPHSLTHYVVGRLVGVRFKYYFLSRSAIRKLNLPVLSALASKLPILALKIDQDSLRSVSRGGRAVTFVSGAASSMIFPFFVAVVSINRVPSVSSTILFLVSAGNVAFDLYYSPKAGDISRARSKT